MTASKGELRTQFSAARRSLSDHERSAAQGAVRGHVLARAGEWTCVAAYEPLRTEPGSVELLTGLVELGVRVLVPVTLPDNDLDWTEWGSGAPLGLDAIGLADAVLVPALAVAAGGTRLGRGGGSYDRALRRCAAGTTRAALLFAGELVPVLPRDEWDEPVTHVVQPDGWRAVGTARG